MDEHQEWREKVCDRCEICHDPLHFLEGPFCDLCLEQEFERRWDRTFDRYALWRGRSVYTVADDDGDEVSGERPVANDDEVRGQSLRSTYAVRLDTQEVICYHPTPSTIRTLRPVSGCRVKAH